MKTRILEMREGGVAVSKGDLKQKPTREGVLDIRDTRENSYNRIIKMAYLTDNEGQIIKQLYNVSIVYLSGDKMSLTGFERIADGGRLIDYAQSWLCLIASQEWDYDNDNLKPRPRNYRL